MNFEGNLDIPGALYQKVIGQRVMELVQGLKVEEIHSQADTEAMEALSKIVEILDEDGTDDAECFRRIEEIIGVLRDSGIAAMRHDW